MKKLTFGFGEYIVFNAHTKFLPFDDVESKLENIALLTVNTELEFPSHLWQLRSKEVMDLCLEKDPKTRLSIDNFRKHNWLNL
jgi:hypothetical protein